MENRHPSVQNLWQNFILSHPKHKNSTLPDVWHFCNNKDDANHLAELVVKSIKQATSASLWWYEVNEEPLPQIGDLYIITNWEGIAKAIIEVTKIDEVPFNKVSAEYAKIEGEGDKSLGYWKKTHWNYYENEMKPYHLSPSQNMIIICEQFKTIWS